MRSLTQIKNTTDKLPTIVIVDPICTWEDILPRESTTWTSNPVSMRAWSQFRSEPTGGFSELCH